MKKDSGYYRTRKGKGCTYHNERGQLIVSKPIRTWIESLAVPPAWEDVWISKDRQAYLLATGSDAKQRTQYIYHPDAAILRESKKLERLLKLGAKLPTIKRRIAKDLNHTGLGKTRVLAAVVKTILDTGIRVGNEQYTKANETYGATTLHKKHVSGTTKKTFDYTGKSGVHRTVSVFDPAVVQVIRACEGTPGAELFKYVDEAGHKHDITSDDVNNYIKQVAECSVTAKDFRTWYGSVAALEKCIELGKCHDVCEQSHMKTIFTYAAKRLGNTPKIAAESYVHESVLAAHKRTKLKIAPSTDAVQLTETEELFLGILRGWSDIRFVSCILT
jgi:DNA topoisomerase-1